ncbi:nuclear transport factor 2 family protein [Sinomicrobium weinanense]|uniref:Nuclear transport factor 2 family protein n=1 Tax=Sinomicrobium weinanense TaxID=2842200 RepID=A0A926JNY0_9FLAO|nr:nuclear transport factor 2 family protein [Sinomicrobium weinanense]MBC9794607.1 nuclear transport factor 2 family protein [Sinomicrobium weinanense]MBU3124092.1 nuclear transport factor 2 family protein [Sinomicrobium weinanense]
MNATKTVVENFLEFLSKRALDQLINLFSDKVDWYIPGDTSKAKWLGKRNNRQELKDLFTLLWSNTEPQMANISKIFIDRSEAVIAGEFITKMVPTGKIVESIFFIHLVVENNKIVKYRLLEDSFAVSKSLE